MIEKDILLDDIIVLPHRTRTGKEKTPEMDRLVNSIKSLGLFHPILINEDNELIAGFRRLTAYKTLRQEDPLQFNKIRARILPASDEYKQFAAEVDENWARKELKGYELDTALARLHKLYQKLYPETKREATLKRGKDDPTTKKQTPSRNGETAKRRKIFEVKQAEIMGLSRSTVEKRVRVGKAIEKKLYTKTEIEAYKKGEVSHTKMLDTHVLRKKLTKQLEESLEIEKKKVKKPRIHPDAPDVVWDGPQLVGDSPETIDKAMENKDYPKEQSTAFLMPKQPEKYECILSVEYGVRQKIEGLTIDEVREWFITILSSDKLWKEIGEPFEMMIGIVSFSEKDKVLDINE